MRFYEITKNAVRAAIEEAEGLNDNLVNAQQARRALDYLVGFNLSPLLWKKIKPGLSAGRVQSVALRLICEREAEIAAFIRQEYWTIEADAAKDKARFPARLIEYRGEKVEADTQKGRFTITARGGGPRGRAHDHRRRRRLADGGWRRAQAEAPQSAAAVHDLDAAAGIRAQARLHGAAHDADRTAAVRVGAHHLHAHGLGDPVDRARSPRCATSSARPSARRRFPTA